MFYLAYISHELWRRRGRTALTAVGLALAVAVVVTVNSLTNGIQQAQADVLHPLEKIGTDVLVTRSVVQSPDQPSSADQKALVAEGAEADRAQLLDLAQLGKPGEHFEHDFFLPATELTFPTDRAAAIRKLRDIAGVSTGLTLVVSHREGTVPVLIAELTSEAATIDLSTLPPPAPPTQSEVDAVNACTSRINPPGTPPPPDTSPEFIRCLPQRFRLRQIQRTVTQQLIAPPHTNINSTNYTVAGVDTTVPGMGILTESQIVRGSFFAPPPVEPQVVLNTAYAARSKLGVGGTLMINGTRFKIVGIAQPPLGGLISDVYLKLDELQRLSFRPGRINLILVRASRPSALDGAVKAIGIAFPEAQIATSKTVANQVTGSLADANRLTSSVRDLLSLVALASAFLFAIQLTLSSVAKRMRELGTLRALGWRKGQVLRQIAGESVAQGIAGGILGLSLGVAATLAFARFGPNLEAITKPIIDPTNSPISGPLSGPPLEPAMHQAVHIYPVLDIRVILLGLGCAVLGGLVAGAAGSLRAARLSPADALRALG